MPIEVDDPGYLFGRPVQLSPETTPPPCSPEQELEVAEQMLEEARKLLREVSKALRSVYVGMHSPMPSILDDVDDFLAKE
jgi:hypothetical protein